VEPQLGMGPPDEDPEPLRLGPRDCALFGANLVRMAFQLILTARIADRVSRAVNDGGLRQRTP